MTNVVQELEVLASEVEAEAKAVAIDVKEEISILEPKVEEQVAKVEEVLKAAESELAGLTEAELRKLHDEAIVVEDALKKELYVLRQRAANLATNVEADVEHEIIALKGEVAKAEAWLKKVEAELVGKLKDIWGTVFE